MVTISIKKSNIYVFIISISIIANAILGVWLFNAHTANGRLRKAFMVKVNEVNELEDRLGSQEVDSMKPIRTELQAFAPLSK